MVDEYVARRPGRLLTAEPGRHVSDGAIDDSAALSRARERLNETTELLRLAQEAASAGIWAWDVKRDVVWLSRECARLNCVPCIPAHDGVEVPIEIWLAHVHADDRSRVETENRRAIAERHNFEIELRVVPSDVEGPRWLHSIGTVVLDDESGEPLRVVGLDVDVTRRKADEARMAHMARHDGLTGLVNRCHFRDLLDTAICNARREGRCLSILAIDLDRFKSVNDTYGHPVGDALLRRVTSALLDSCSKDNVVARLGGDEFAIIRPFQKGQRSDSEAAEALIVAVGATGVIDGRAITVGASVGIAVFPNDGSDAEDLIKAADMALRAAKEDGGRSFSVFNADLYDREMARYALEADLRVALVEEQFVLHYQPVCEALDGRVVSFEALLRWRHPVRGLLAPAAFIALAEETGLIVLIGDWVLRTACVEAQHWPSDVGVAVNVSAIQLRRDGFALRVASALALAGLAPHRLEIEITESVIMQEPRAIGCIEDLRRLGVRVALDDFGTGYSSLSYLLQLHFDRIKLDRSFVTNIGDLRAETIVRSVVAMARALDMAVTAEGVETYAQFQMARALGCTEMQGYLFGKPIAIASAPHGWASFEPVAAPTSRLQSTRRRIRRS